MLALPHRLPTRSGQSRGVLVGGISAGLDGETPLMDFGPYVVYASPTAISMLYSRFPSLLLRTKQINQGFQPDDHISLTGMKRTPLLKSETTPSEPPG